MIIPAPSRSSELGSGTAAGGVAATVPLKLATSPWAKLMTSCPDKAKAPERAKVVGIPAVLHDVTGGALEGFTQRGVASVTPASGAKLFPASPAAVNAPLSPTAASVKVPLWLADRVSGLPSGKAKLFTAKLTVRDDAPPVTLVAPVFVSNAKAAAGLPGELLVKSTDVIAYPPTVPPLNDMALLPRLVVNPLAVHAVTPAEVELLHETVVMPFCKLKNASACAAGL